MAIFLYIKASGIETAIAILDDEMKQIKSVEHDYLPTIGTLAFYLTLISPTCSFNTGEKTLFIVRWQNSTAMVKR